MNFLLNYIIYNTNGVLMDESPPKLCDVILKVKQRPGEGDDSGKN